MDTAALAAATVGLLGPMLAQVAGGGFARVGETLTDPLAERVRGVYQAVRRRFSGRAYEEAVLDGAEQDPDSEARMAALEAVLREALESDPEFAERIADLVKGVGVTIEAHDSGAVAGGDLTVNAKYAAGRDLQIGDGAS